MHKFPAVPMQKRSNICSQDRTITQKGPDYEAALHDTTHLRSYTGTIRM